jgi:hypothetical protein
VFNVNMDPGFRQNDGVHVIPDARLAVTPGQQSAFRGQVIRNPFLRRRMDAGVRHHDGRSLIGLP